MGGLFEVEGAFLRPGGTGTQCSRSGPYSTTTRGCTRAAHPAGHRCCMEGGLPPAAWKLKGALGELGGEPGGAEPAAAVRWRLRTHSVPLCANGPTYPMPTRPLSAGRTRSEALKADARTRSTRVHGGVAVSVSLPIGLEWFGGRTLIPFMA